MVFYKKGDLFESEADILCHGVNCKGAFGSGVAGQIAQKYPEVRAAYLEKHNQEGWKLKDVQFVFLNNKKQTIANCATQNDYFPRNQVHSDYGAILACMDQVKAFAQQSNLSIAMPKIGAGLAGGDWYIIEAILKDVFNDYDCTVYFLG